MENRFKLLSEADLESLSSKSKSTKIWKGAHQHGWTFTMHGPKWGTRNQTLKVILLTNWIRFCAKISSYSVLQILIHTINSESHGFFGQFWENRPSVLFWSFSNRPHCVRAILKNFKMNLGLFIPNCPQTHAITNTNNMPVVCVNRTFLRRR